MLWSRFMVSGAAALALEMLWMRSATLILGQTAARTASALTGDFGGPELGAVTDVFASAPLNDHNRPFIEFTAPRLTHTNAAGKKDWFAGAPLTAFYNALDRRPWGSPDPLFPPSDAVRRKLEAIERRLGDLTDRKDPP